MLHLLSIAPNMTYAQHKAVEDGQSCGGQSDAEQHGQQPLRQSLLPD